MAVLLFGLAGLFGKFIALPPTIIVLGRVFFAATALLSFVLISRQSITLRHRRDYWAMIALGGLMAAHWTAFFESIQVSSVAIGLISCSTFPVFATFIEPYVFKEKVRLADIGVALIIIPGVFLVVPELDLRNDIAQGMAWGFVAAFLFAVIAVVNRKYVKTYSSQIIALYQDAAATVMLLPFLVAIQPVFQLENIILLALLGVVFTALSHSLFIKGMASVKAQTASMIASLEPLYGILMAMVVLGEIPDVRTLAGGAVVFAAVFHCTSRARHSEEQVIVQG